MSETIRVNNFLAKFAPVMILIAGCVQLSSANAQEWRIEPRLSVGGEADDNATLDTVTAQEPDIAGLLLEAAARVNYKSQTADFVATPRFRSRDYGDENFDSDDQFLDLRFVTTSVSTDFSVDASYSRELIRTAERLDTDLDITDPDEVPVDLSTRLDFRDRREQIEVEPGFDWTLSQISSLNGRVRYTDVDYDENFQGLLNDYSNLRGSLGYQRDWSPRNSGLIEATYRKYEPDGQESVDSVGLGVGFVSRLTETTRLRVLVGAENTDLAVNGNDTNVIANVSLVRRLKTISMFAQYRRVIAGGGGGSLTARDMLNLNFKRDLSERLSAGIGARAYTTSALEKGIVTPDERDYLQLRGLFTWRASRAVTIDLSYRYTILSRELIGESANSNSITIWFNWSPNARTP